MPNSDLIYPRHLSRRAMIYVRQSTPQQVISRQESQRLQYALRDRAIDLGWHELDVEIVDIDLGMSAATTEGRLGFQHLVSEIALGKVGVVIAYDATRLARNCTHWYELLDLCGRTDCLIADRDGVYNPSSINGRLLLGLKGQISELELHTIRSRMNAGRLSKAERGELAVCLPVGLVRFDDGSVEKHSNREVQDRISFIFKMLLEKKSVGKLVQYLNQQGLQVPCQSRSYSEGLCWRRASIGNIGGMVRNPAYAGAFVYGRRMLKPSENMDKSREETARGSRAILPRSQWHVCIHDKYPAYISWESFEEIEKMLQDNYAEYDRNKTRGFPRDGEALLQGIVYCGHCGHKMCIQYKGGSQYICNRLRQISPGDPVCQRFSSGTVDDQVVRWFLEALSSAEIDASQQTLIQADQQNAIALASRQQQLTRLRYQVQRAERQFQLADPENRLVAAELEHRWESALQDLKTEEERLSTAERSTASWSIPEEVLILLRDVGRRLPELWASGMFTTAQQKTLLRSLIDKVVVQRIGGSKGDRVHVRVVWQGGASTSGEVPIRVGQLSQLQNVKEMEQAAVQYSQEGFTAPSIAEQLTEAGYRSPKSDRVLTSTVRTILNRNGIVDLPKSRPVRVPGYLTISQLAQKLKIRRQWFLEQIATGAIRGEKRADTRCYLFPDTQQTEDEILKIYHKNNENHV